MKIFLDRNLPGNLNEYLPEGCKVYLGVYCPEIDISKSFIESYFLKKYKKFKFSFLSGEDVKKGVLDAKRGKKGIGEQNIIIICIDEKPQAMALDSNYSGWITINRGSKGEFVYYNKFDAGISIGKNTCLITSLTCNLIIISIFSIVFRWI